MAEISVVFTSQWPAVVHKCPGGLNGYRTVRFGICRDGEEVGCGHCGKIFHYQKATPSLADRFQWGPPERTEQGHR